MEKVITNYEPEYRTYVSTEYDKKNKTNLWKYLTWSKRLILLENHITLANYNENNRIKKEQRDKAMSNDMGKETRERNNHIEGRPYHSNAKQT